MQNLGITDIHGQSHQQCNSQTGCGIEYYVDGKRWELEGGELVLCPEAAQSTKTHSVKGIAAQIISKLNQKYCGKVYIDGGEFADVPEKNFDIEKIAVVDELKPHNLIINKKNSLSNTQFELEGTPRQIASYLNEYNNNGDSFRWCNKTANVINILENGGEIITAIDSTDTGRYMKLYLMNKKAGKGTEIHANNKLDYEVLKIREIKEPDDKIDISLGYTHEAKVSIVESLGERGEYRTFVYKSKPTISDIDEDVKETYKDIIAQADNILNEYHDMPIYHAAKKALTNSHPAPSTQQAINTIHELFKGTMTAEKFRQMHSIEKKEEQPNELSRQLHEKGIIKDPANKVKNKFKELKNILLQPFSRHQENDIKKKVWMQNPEKAEAAANRLVETVNNNIEYNSHWGHASKAFIDKNGQSVEVQLRKNGNKYEWYHDKNKKAFASFDNAKDAISYIMKQPFWENGELNKSGRNDEYFKRVKAAQIKTEIENGNVLEDIEKGKITATDAKTIIENAGITAPADILALTEKNLQSGGEVAPVIEVENPARWQKKKEHIQELANNIQRLRLNITNDLKSNDQKIFLTALVVALMDKTGERVGNEDSASNGHFGITGLQKDHISFAGNKVILNYTGKSGVEHEKEFTDIKLSKYLKKAIRKSPGKFVFVTTDDFKIKADTVNRYLTDFNVTAKDIRGYSANKWIIDKLNCLPEIPSEENKRKREFNAIVKKIAQKIGHGSGTLKKHYLIPELSEQFIIHGKIIDIKNLGYTMDKGGEVPSIQFKIKKLYSILQTTSSNITETSGNTTEINGNEKNFVKKLLEDIIAGIQYNNPRLEKAANKFGITDRRIIKELAELSIVIHARKIANE